MLHRAKRALARMEWGTEEPAGCLREAEVFALVAIAEALEEANLARRPSAPVVPIDPDAAS